MSGRDLAAWLALLEQRHPKKIDLGLERIRRVALAMQLLPVDARVITVAGTNGKGSTVAVADSLLRHSGHAVLSFTSPHLVRYNERFHWQGAEVSDQAICEAFGAIESARQSISLSYFEFSLLAALWLAKRYAVDRLVLEVGLGGRLDACNIVDPDVAVITRIDLDHQDWLGDTRELIALEKAGILRPGKPAVISDQDPPESLRGRVQELGSKAQWIGRDFGLDAAGNFWSSAFSHGAVRCLVPSGLLGNNVVAALEAVRLLGTTITAELLHRALPDVRLQGRCQRLPLPCGEAIVDVSHNPASAELLATLLRRESSLGGQTFAVFSAMADKDIHGILAACSGHIDRWFIPELPQVQRAAKCDDIIALLKERGCKQVCGYASPELALDASLAQLQEKDRLVVFGSFYTVGAVLPALLELSNQAQP
jgi:dihydrofolate synthase/folylpolyglutamate synthase